MNRYDSLRSTLSDIRFPKSVGRGLGVETIGSVVYRVWGNDCAWKAQKSISQAYHAVARYKEEDKYNALQYLDLKSLFAGYNVFVKARPAGTKPKDAQESVAYFFGSNQPPKFDFGTKRGCEDHALEIFQNGFSLVAKTGLAVISNYIYQPGMTTDQILAAQDASDKERSAGRITSCGPYGDITPTQAKAILRSSGFSGELMSTQACVRQLALPSGAVPGGGGFLANGTKDSRFGVSQHDQTKPSDLLDLWGGGAASPSDQPTFNVRCPDGFVAPSQAPTCGPGEYLYAHPGTGCVRCAVAQNCWFTGANPLPCPSPLVVNSHGRISCCEQTAALPYAPPPDATVPPPDATAVTTTPTAAGFLEGKAVWALGGLGLLGVMYYFGTKKTGGGKRGRRD